MFFFGFFLPFGGMHLCCYLEKRKSYGPQRLLLLTFFWLSEPCLGLRPRAFPPQALPAGSLLRPCLGRASSADARGGLFFPPRPEEGLHLVYCQRRAFLRPTDCSQQSSALPCGHLEPLKPIMTQTHETVLFDSLVPKRLQIAGKCDCGRVYLNLYKYCISIYMISFP